MGLCRASMVHGLPIRTARPAPQSPGASTIPALLLGNRLRDKSKEMGTTVCSPRQVLCLRQSKNEQSASRLPTSMPTFAAANRSEERRVGKEYRDRWSRGASREEV